MSKEAFPVLPDKAAEHITHLPEDMQSSIGSLLLNLTHESLHQQNTSTFRRRKSVTPIPRESFAHEHHEHVERVTTQMAGASELLGAAFTELEHGENRTTGDINVYAVADKARDIALECAQKAKAAGAEQDTVSYLESVITIESLLALDKDDSVEASQRKKDVVRSIVSQGLALEFIDATHSTYGVVALGEARNNFVPLCSLAQENINLLSAATTCTVEGNFSRGAPRNTFDFGAHAQLAAADLLSMSVGLGSSEKDQEHRRLLARVMFECPAARDTTSDVNHGELLAFASNALRDIKPLRKRGIIEVVSFIEQNNLQQELDALAKDDSALNETLTKVRRAFKVHEMIQSGDLEIAKISRDVREELEAVFGDYYKQLSNMTTVEYSKILIPRPQINDLTVLTDSVRKFGISSELVEKVVGSWLSFSSGRKKVYERDFSKEDPVGDHVSSMISEQVSVIGHQLESFMNYVAEYGLVEVEEIIDTFGIHNFARYEPLELHDQMERWRKGSDQVINVVVVAHEDWNGSMTSTGDDFQQTFGASDGTFFFEASTPSEVSNVAVKIGKRERNNERNPSVTNFVISAHGSPETLLFTDFPGSDRGRITSTLYRDNLGQNGRLRLNSYARHLGSQFRVILKSCSPTEKSDSGKNIAESMADYHSIEVVGCPGMPIGPIKIDADGNVIYMVEKGDDDSLTEVKGVVYGRSHK